MKETPIKCPWRDGKQGYWCAPICKINNFVKYLRLNAPIIGGSWNPAEYVNKNHFKTFIDWLKENYPECLNPDDSENILYAAMGETFENPEIAEHSVDIFDATYNYVEHFVGDQIGGMRVKAPAFGRLGVGKKFFADYYYEKGGILTYCSNDTPGEGVVRFAQFFTKDTWKKMGCQVQDSTEYEDYNLDDLGID